MIGRPTAVRFSVAGIAVEIVSADPEMAIRLDPALHRFQASTAVPDVRLTACWGELTPACDGLELFDSGATWKLYSRGGSYIFHCFAPNLGAAPYQVASFDDDFLSGHVSLHRPYFDVRSAANPLQYPIDELLVLHLLARGRGVELHACGLVDGSGDGYVFAGQSGAGKTTMARLWASDPAVIVLSDDRVILRKHEGRFWIYGTPWHGEADLAQPARAPLKQLFFLRQARENSLVSTTAADATARLVSCAFPTFHDRGGLEFALAFLAELATSVPCCELRVVPDERIVPFIRARTT